MSNTLAGSDGDRKITIRASSSLVDAFDEAIDGDYSSRSDAIRTYLRSVADGGRSWETPRQPPTEELLADAYRSLVDVARATGSENGYVREPTARRVVAGGKAGLSKDDARDRLLRPLVRRGYLRRVGNVQGDTSYQILGINDNE